MSVRKQVGAIRAESPSGTSPSADDRIVALLERIALAVEALVAERAAPDVLTAPQFADLLQVDLRTLREMRRGGDVPRGFMCGRSPRWKRSTIETWMVKAQQ